MKGNSDTYAQNNELAIVGIHTIYLLSRVQRADFEKFMIEEVFPEADNAAGVSRGGHSPIKSQHLVQSDTDEREYLWIIKGSGVFDNDAFRRIFRRMFETVREKLGALGTHKASTTYVVIDSLDVGPRDQLGRPTGSPKRGSEI